jgi:beta-glucanase (GH16 family)
MKRFLLFVVFAVMAACVEKTDNATTITILPDGYTTASAAITTEKGSIYLPAAAWVTYNIQVREAGRYRIEIEAIGDTNTHVWVEDYADNTADRVYNITGMLQLGEKSIVAIDGAPLDAGTHQIKVHAAGGKVHLKKIRLIQLFAHVETNQILQQSTDGNQWELVWSDEFDGEGLPDTSKWRYNVGNWGWGNNELQYYTAFETRNARQENGNLIIEAHKENGQWTSARLTTAGKYAFLEGRIVFRAKVPTGRGTWAAGWLLGSSYKDEQSWPRCGEIDVLECVGFEINDGNGYNHASCHTPAYFFKKNNQITGKIAVEQMHTTYHEYAIEWYPDSIAAFVDGQHYYTYDKNANADEWPFFEPQCIILNLAIGGGWGGAKGVDPNLGTQRFEIDYVRVYQSTKTAQP